ncbi:MAG: sugar phosphate isomerase/epimerase [Armatimonadetes bacterium]|nr:sugar phosphate isomerase/epimerase [Armatimonadota bacterium]
MKTALHSVSYAGVWPGQARLPVEAVIEKASAFGYDGVMLVAKRPHASLLDMGPDPRKRLRALMEDKGVALAAVAGYNDFCGGSDTPDVPYREMQILYIAELARLARDLGGGLVRVFTGFERPSLSYDLQWGWCVESLRESARRAAQWGVTLCVQNHHDIAAHHESLYDLLTEVGETNCKAAFDAWSPALQGADLGAAVRKMGPFIAHTTVADYVRRSRFAYRPRLVNYAPEADIVRAVPMGEGFVDYRAFFTALNEVGYYGYVGYEMCSALEGGGGEENLDRCARRFLAWMKEQGFAG